MASGAFNQPAGLPGRSPLHPMRATHSRSASVSSQTRPSTAASSDPGSSAFHDAFEEQDPGELSREFDNVKNLLSLVGSASASHQLGGYAQHAFPRVFRANISQRRVMEELETLRSLVLKAMESSSRPGSSASSVAGAGPSSPLEEGFGAASGLLTPVRRRGSAALEDSAIDMDFLTPVAEEKEDPVVKSMREKNRELIGASEETMEQLAQARAQVERLENLVRKNEEEAYSLRRQLEAREGLAKSHENKARELAESHTERMRRAEQSHEAAVKNSDDAMKDLREKHERHKREMSANLDEKDGEAKKLLSQHARQIQEQESVFAAKLAEKDGALQLERNQHENALRELEESYEREKEVETNYWQKEVARHRAKYDAAQGELKKRHESIDELSGRIATLSSTKDRELADANRKLKERADKYTRELEHQSSAHRQDLNDKNQQHDQLRNDHEERVRELNEKHQRELDKRSDLNQRAWDDKDVELTKLRHDSARREHELSHHHAQEPQEQADHHGQAVQEKQQQMTNLRTEHRNALENLRNAHVAELQEQSEASQRALNESQNETKSSNSSYEQRVQDLERTHRGILQKQSDDKKKALDDMTAELTRLQAAHQKTLDELRIAHERQIQQDQLKTSDEAKEAASKLEMARQSIDNLEKQVSNHKMHNEELQIGHEEALTKSRSEHQSAIDDLRSSHTKMLDKIKSEHTSAVSALQNQLEAKSQELSRLEVNEQNVAELKRIHEHEKGDQETIALADAERTKRDYDDKITALRKDHAEALSTARAEFEQTLKEHEKQLDDAEKLHGTQVSVLKERHAVEMQKIKEDQENSAGISQRKLEELRKQIADSKWTHEARISEMEERHNRHIAEMTAMNETTLSKLREEKDSELSDLSQRHKQVLNEDQNEHARALDTEKTLHSESKQARSQLTAHLDEERRKHVESCDKYRADLSNVANTHKEEIGKVIREADERLTTLRREHAQENQNLQDGHDSALKSTQTEYSCKLEDEKKRHAGTQNVRNELLTRLKSERQDHAEAAKNYEQKLSETVNKHKNEIQSTSKEADERLESVNAEHGEKVHNLKKELRRISEALEEQKQSHSTTHANHQRALTDIASSRNDDHEKATRQAEERLQLLQKQHAEEITGLKKEKDSVTKQLEERKQTHAQLQRSHQQNLDRIANAHKNDVEEAIRYADERLASLRSEHTEQISNLKGYHDRALQALQKDKESSMEQIRSRHALETEQTREETNQEISNAKARHEKIIQDLKTEYEGLAQQQGGEFAQRVSNALSASRQDLEDEKKAHARELREVRASYEAQIRDQHVTLEQVLEKQKQKNTQEIDQVKATQASQVAKLQEDHQRILYEHKKQLQIKLRDEFRTQSNRQKGENDHRIAELARNYDESLKKHGAAQADLRRQLQEAKDTAISAKGQHKLPLDNTQPLASGSSDAVESSSGKQSADLQPALTAAEARLAELEERLKQALLMTDEQKHAEITEQEKRGWESKIAEIEHQHRVSISQIEAQHRERMVQKVHDITAILRAEHSAQLQEVERNIVLTGRRAEETRAAQLAELATLKRSHEEALAKQNTRIIQTETQVQRQSRENHSLRERLASTVATLNTLRTGSSNSYASHLRTTQERLSSALLDRSQLEKRLADQEQQLRALRAEIEATKESHESSEETVLHTSLSAEKKDILEELSALKQHYQQNAATESLTVAEHRRDTLSRLSTDPKSNTSEPLGRLRPNTFRTVGMGRSLSDSKWASNSNQQGGLNNISRKQDLKAGQSSAPLEQLASDQGGHEVKPTIQRSVVTRYDLEVSPKTFEEELAQEVEESALERAQSKRQFAMNAQRATASPRPAGRAAPLEQKRAAGLGQSKYASIHSEPHAVADSKTQQLPAAENVTLVDSRERSSAIRSAADTASGATHDSRYVSPIMQLRKSSPERRAERYGGAIHHGLASKHAIPKQKRVQRSASNKEWVERTAGNNVASPRRLTESELERARPQGSRDGPRTMHGRVPSLAERWSSALGNQSGRR